MGQTDSYSIDTDGNVWREYYTCPYCGACLGEVEMVDALDDDGTLGCDTCHNDVYPHEAAIEWMTEDMLQDTPDD